MSEQEFLDILTDIHSRLSQLEALAGLTQEESDPISEQVDNEECRQRDEAWDVVLGYLSHQYLPYPVKVAYDHILKGLEYDG